MTSNYREKYNQLLGSKTTIEQNLMEDKKELQLLGREFRKYEQAREIVKEVAQKTQQELQYHLSDITSLAMEAVFPKDPYKIIIDFVQRRNKTECDIYFERDGNKADPLTASGGGAVDVGSFALRVASWSMQNPKTRNVLILDEPFSRLKGVEANKRAIQMIKQLSHKLNLQIIMISDERVSMEEIEQGADKIFHVGIHKKGEWKISKVVEKINENYS